MFTLLWESCVLYKYNVWPRILQKTIYVGRPYGEYISYNNMCVHSATITATTIHSWFARFEPEFVLNNQVTTCV